MASSYPYVLSNPRIVTMFAKIRETGPPARVDTKWLKQIGLTGGNDARLLHILSHLGFIDASKAPTQIWKEYRGQRSKQVLGTAIRSAYSQLFQMYPRADQQSDDDLLNFVRSNTDYATDTARRAVSAFKTLVSLADMEAGDLHTAADVAESLPTVSSEGSDAPAKQRVGHPIVINVNLQLTLPESTDPTVYESLFAALSKHVLREGPDES